LEKPKTSLFGSLFRKSHEEEYPKSEPYFGDYEHLNRHLEHPHHEIGEHALLYHSGVYDKPSVIETTPTLKGLIVNFR
jgi:hypothetical protein